MQHYCEIPTPKGTMRGFFHKPDLDRHPDENTIFHGFTGQKTGTEVLLCSISKDAGSKRNSYI